MSLKCHFLVDPPTGDIVSGNVYFDHGKCQKAQDYLTKQGIKTQFITASTRRSQVRHALTHAEALLKKLGGNNDEVEHRLCGIVSLLQSAVAEVEPRNKTCVKDKT